TLGTYCIVRRMTDFSRREFGSLVLAGLPLSLLLDKINSRIGGVQVGAITYSFRALPSAEDVLKAYTTIGLGEMELMSNHCETLAGAPGGRSGGGATRGRGALTPEQQAARDAAVKALADFRKNATEATFAPVKKRISDMGVELKLLCYNMNVDRTTDD